MSELPKGWSSVSLNSLGKWTGGGTPSKSNPDYWVNEGIPWVSPKDMKRLYIDDAEDHITEAAVANSSTNLVPRDAILVVTRSGILAHTLPVAKTMREVAINQDMKALTVWKGIEPDYVLQALRAFQDQILRECGKAGTTVANLDTTRFLGFQIPLPPLAEQRRIVAKLDALFARSRRARAELERVPGLVERAKQAVLAKAFSGAFSQNVDQKEFALHPLERFIRSTFYGPRFAQTTYTTDGIPTLRTTDFTNSGEVVLNSPPTVQVSKEEMLKWGLVDGDILVTRTGSIGKCALYTDNLGPALPSAYLIRVRLDTELMEPRYCLLFLLSRSGQEQLGAGVTAVTQPNINASVIRNLLLPVPTITVQREIVRRIEAAFAHIDRMAAESARATALLDRLEQATLAKAFRGELVGAADIDAAMASGVQAALAGVPAGNGALADGETVQLGMDLG